jgi:hypothetical protein
MRNGVAATELLQRLGIEVRYPRADIKSELCPQNDHTGGLNCSLSVKKTDRDSAKEL